MGQEDAAGTLERVLVHLVQQDQTRPDHAFDEPLERAVHIVLNHENRGALDERERQILLSSGLHEVIAAPLRIDDTSLGMLLVAQRRGTRPLNNMDLMVCGRAARDMARWMLGMS